jgi:ABC-2 type transport system ATP-binding protein
MIEVTGLTKTYGPVRAVDGLSFTAPSGRITGFLGPNGSGKTTTLRMVLGLAKPTSGQALIGGVPYRQLRDPLRHVGAVLEQGIAHPGQSGRAHLRTHAMFVGARSARVEQLLELVGLADAAGRRVGGYSLGMRQRLAVATALIGDPAVLVLDEPANGLDPEGIAWLRGLLRHQANAGRTVLISSHLLAELAQTVDDVVVIAEGRLVRQAALAELAAAGPVCLRIRVDDPDRLFEALAERGTAVERDGDYLRVRGRPSEELGYVAHTAGVVVYELTTETADLEQAFLTLVRKP